MASDHRVSDHDSAQIIRWHQQADLSALQQTIVQYIEASAAAALKTRGEFHIVLAGGRTPEKIYAQLRALKTDWRAWSIYFGDERCLPNGDVQRNDSMARSAWLDAVPIPAAQIHSIPAQLGPIIGAQRYAAELADTPIFDLVLLGLGEDGHTASLFPNDKALKEHSPAVAIHNAPKPPAERISMSAARLSRARAVFFIVTGIEKASALNRWRQGEQLPASLITPANGVDIYTDILLAR